MGLYRCLLLAGIIGLAVSLPGQSVAQDYQQELTNLSLRERQLETEALEAELAHQNQMRALEVEARRVEIDHMRNGPPAPKDQAAGAVFLLCLVVNILMAIWVYADNRSRDAGQGIWIAICLLAGFFGALVYAVIRLGDVSRAASPRSTAARK